MFLNENELVNRLIELIQEKYGVKYIVKELRGGNNIADIVYIETILREEIVFDEYIESYFYFSKIRNKKKIDPNNWNAIDTIVWKKIATCLKRLADMNYIEIQDDIILNKKKVEPISSRFVAIEAKMTDWRAGIEQAIRYKQFADVVYVALNEDAAQKADKQMYTKYNVGLIGVTEKRIKMLVRARKEKVEKLEVQYYVMDKFLKQYYDHISN